MRNNVFVPSGKTHSVQITKSSQMKLYRETAAITCESVKKHKNAVCDEKPEASHVKAHDTGLCSGYHRVLEASGNCALLNTYLLHGAESFLRS